jgi:hypothetical protein
MSKISGFSFNVKDDGSVVPIAGKAQKPHALDFINSSLSDFEKNNLSLDALNNSLSNLFFNFQRDDCETALNLAQRDEYLSLFDKWKLIQNQTFQRAA